MPRIGPLGIWEILIILVVILLIFGPRRLPEMAKGIGQSVREFRKGIRDMKDDFESGNSNDQPSKKQANESATAATADSTSLESKPAKETAGDGEAPEETKVKTDAESKPVEPKAVDTV